jgi:hypothetical protein
VVIVTSSELSNPASQRASELNIKTVEVNDLIDIISDRDALDVLDQYTEDSSITTLEQSVEDNEQILGETYVPEEQKETQTSSQADRQVENEEERKRFDFFTFCHIFPHVVFWGYALLILDYVPVGLLITFSIFLLFSFNVFISALAERVR